jgi:hypothetical protein
MLARYAYTAKSCTERIDARRGYAHDGIHA